MANYIEYIKVGTGESWPVRDREAQDKLSNIVDLVYPIGSIYMSMSETSPDQLFGGIWERIHDRFLLAAGNSYGVGQTGGESTHTLTVAEMPNHGHDNIYIMSDGAQLRITYENQANPGTGYGAGIGVNGNNNIRVTSTGGGQPHNNMPPYLAVYMWKRIG